ncbi:MAG: hypothetical protein DF168_01869 [Candidatus Moanabacter tarae]|uniref:Uncharacterized protein n=1 Tax=Candidatus Moanibacter tarae TaxID=2200854 RepID=A0A2Z4ARI7_9BACT|nr:MAG: hypothetical protein DF168_01869 [Candidatus Moanabacter tarae]
MTQLLNKLEPQSILRILQQLESLFHSPQTSTPYRHEATKAQVKYDCSSGDWSLILAAGRSPLGIIWKHKVEI